MQLHLIRHPATPLATLSEWREKVLASLGHMRAREPLPANPHLLHDIGLIDERPYHEDHPASRHAAIALLRNI